MTEDEIAAVLMRLGSPPEKAKVMAAQLARRAAQLAGQKGSTYDEALAHLLRLTAQAGGFPQEDL